jgi:hypothetical protein
LPYGNKGAAGEKGSALLNRLFFEKRLSGDVSIRCRFSGEAFPFSDLGESLHFEEKDSCADEETFTNVVGVLTRTDGVSFVGCFEEKDCRGGVVERSRKSR